MDNTKNRKRVEVSGAFKRTKKKKVGEFLEINNIILNKPPCENDLIKTNLQVPKNLPIDCDSSDYFEKVAISTFEITNDRNIFNKTDFLIELKYWALLHNINHKQLNSLLKLLNSRSPLTPLPLDARTILQTPRNVEIQNKYWHRGLRKALDLLKNVKTENLPHQISLRFNMDGLPISKSSSSEAWPILVHITDIPYIRPCVVGIYCGPGKPKELEPYLNKFAQELTDCMENGLNVNDRKIRIKLKCFTCDSPGRAMIKGTVYFNHRHGCQKCTAVGVYNEFTKTVVFPKLDAEARTNESFRSKVDLLHHKATTPLLNVPIDLVLDFPVGDALHLLHLGLMKRFLNGWIDGDLGYTKKWGNANVTAISKYLIGCKTPVEIHRQMRSLSEIPRWKGTEFRTFLMYVSIVILRQHLAPLYYEHFLLFYCSIVILNSEYFVKYLTEYADKMIKSFLEIFKQIYGPQHFTSNLHNLSHVVEEVKRLGCLGNFDAYPFENKLQDIKKLIRQKQRPLSELAKRMLEQEAANEIFIKKNENEQNSISLSQLTKFDCDDFRKLGENYLVYKQIHFQDFKINTNKDCDKWVLLKDFKILRCEYVVSFNNRCFLYGGEVIEKQDFFKVPVASSKLFIYSAKMKYTRYKIYDTEDVICKMFRLTYAGNYANDDYDSNNAKNESENSVFIPIWHTLN